MSAPAQDPRYRPFRAAAFGVYLLFTVTFCLFIIVSVYRSVLGMTPDEQPVAGEVLPEEQCFTQLRGLFTELEGARKELGAQSLVVKADARFLQFRVEWLRKKRVLEAQCGLQSREKARAAFASLDRLVDLYTTASVQYAGAVGPTVDEFKTLAGVR